MWATAGAEQMAEARAGVETRKDQVQHVRGGYMPGRGPQGRAVAVSVNLSSISHRGAISTPPRTQWQDPKVKQW